MKNTKSSNFLLFVGGLFFLTAVVFGVLLQTEIAKDTKATFTGVSIGSTLGCLIFLITGFVIRYREIKEKNATAAVSKPEPVNPAVPENVSAV